MDLLFKTKFGSHLYGLNTPSSDTDYKGIYMPTLSQLLLGTWPKSIRTSTGTAHTKNTSEDIDEEYYALPYFIKLAVEGDTTALDMLHANKSSTLVTSPLWEELKSRRQEFYSRDMKALVGYAMPWVDKTLPQTHSKHNYYNYVWVTEDGHFGLVRRHDRAESIYALVARCLHVSSKFSWDSFLLMNKIPLNDYWNDYNPAIAVFFFLYKSKLFDIIVT